MKLSLFDLVVDEQTGERLRFVHWNCWGHAMCRVPGKRGLRAVRVERLRKVKVDHIRRLSNVREKVPAE